ncbi:MAG: hypothetical protein ACRDCE_16815 [Cetobacterium sp.]|uniref:hypothetical protein n=1 Tax=Cetobacterium sp. TaxID=2071632 RepID=UPI003EE79456
MKLIETIGEDGNNTISEYFIDSKITETILELNIKIIKTTEFIEKKIEEIFCEIVYDFEKDKILNGNNIHEKWDKIYTEFLLEKDSDLNELAVNLNKFYANQENIEFILRNASFFPFLIMLLDPKEEHKNLKFYNLLRFEEFEFDITKKIESYKEVKNIIIEGIIPSTFNFMASKKQVRDLLKITLDKIFEMNITFIGNLNYIDDILKTGFLEIKLTTNGYIERYYKLEIGE